jgi:hypothetical protein
MAENETVVGITACSKSKKGSPESDKTYPAEELYDSWLFDGRVDALRANCDRWCIFSAKHGYVEPDDELAWYDCKLSELDDLTQLERANDVAENVTDADRVMILMGRTYANPLMDVLPDSITVDDPLEGVQLFDQRSALDELADGWTGDNQATLSDITPNE